jgi:hypothetical protein
MQCNNIYITRKINKRSNKIDTVKAINEQTCLKATNLKFFNT